MGYILSNRAASARIWKGVPGCREKLCANLGWRGMRKEQKKWIGAIGLILNIIVLMMVI